MKQRTKQNVMLSLAGAVPVAGFCVCWLLPLCMTFWYAFQRSAFDLSFAGFDIRFRVDKSKLIVCEIISLQQEEG